MYNLLDITKQKNNIYLFAIIGFMTPATISAISLLRSFLSQSHVEIGKSLTISLLLFLLPLFVLVVFLFIITDKNWRYGVLFIILSYSIRSVSKIIYQKSNSGAIILLIISLSILVPAFYYFYRFKTSKNISMYVWKK